MGVGRLCLVNHQSSTAAQPAQSFLVKVAPGCPTLNCHFHCRHHRPRHLCHRFLLQSTHHTSVGGLPDDPLPRTPHRRRCQADQAMDFHFYCILVMDLDRPSLILIFMALDQALMHQRLVLLL